MRQPAVPSPAPSGEQALAATIVRIVCVAMLLPVGLNLIRAALAPALAAPLLLFAIWIGSAALTGLQIVRHRRPRLAGAVLLAALFVMALYASFNGGGVRSLGYLSLLSLAFLSVWLVGVRGAAVFVLASLLAGLGLFAAESAGMLANPGWQVTPTQFALSIMTQMVLMILVHGALLSQLRSSSAARLRSEAQYGALVDNAADAILTADIATGLIVEANRRACQLLGRSLAELRAVHLAELYAPEEQAAARAAFGAADPSGQGAITMMALHADGRRLPVELATSRVVGPDGAGLLLAIIRDVSERQRAEAELRASEARFRATFEQAAVGMCHTNLEGAFLRINRRFCEIVGYSRDELMSLSFRELTHPEDLDADVALGRRLVAGELTTYALEKRYIRKDGATIWVNLTVSPVLGAGGATEELQAVAEDITARKQAEWELRQLNATLEERVGERTLALSSANSRLQAEIGVRLQVGLALRESEARYRDLLESLRQGVVVFQDDRVVFSNLALAEILGRSVDDLLSYGPEQLQLLIFGEDQQRVNSTIEQYFDTGEVFPDRPFRFYRPDGELRWVYSWSRMISYSGRPAVLGVISDVTDLKRAEDQLRQSRDELRAANEELGRAARLKDEFLANMSHELRTPLNAILGRAELLAEELHGPLNERQRRSVAGIDESGRHLLELINDILDLSKIEAGKLELQLDLVSVNDLCEASLRMVSHGAARKAIALSSAVDPQIVLLQGDPRRLKQLLVNLLANAVKFTPTGGSVGLEVRGDEAAGTVIFAVSDTGIGIAEDDVPRLFRPFEQLDSKLSRQYEGTGLGLSLVARLARLHGGSVAVESAPGRGSRFSVTLPWRPHKG